MDQIARVFISPIVPLGACYTRSAMSDGWWTSLGLLFLLYTAYAFGFLRGRYPDDDDDAIWRRPGWIQAGIFTAVAGVLIIIIANSTGQVDREY